MKSQYRDKICHVGYRDFVGFVHSKNDGRNVLVVTNRPNEQATKINRIDELTKRFSRSPGKIGRSLKTSCTPFENFETLPNFEWSSFFLGDICLVNQA